MKTINVTIAALFLKSTSDIGFVKQFYEKAKAKLDSIDFGAMGIRGFTNDFQFQPYQVALPTGQTAVSAGDTRSFMAFIDDVEAPAAGDLPGVRQAKVEAIDQLGRLAANAALRIAAEVPDATPTLTEMAGASGGASGEGSAIVGLDTAARGAESQTAETVTGTPAAIVETPSADPSAPPAGQEGGSDAPAEKVAESQTAETPSIETPAAESPAVSETPATETTATDPARESVTIKAEDVGAIPADLLSGLTGGDTEAGK